MPAISRRERDQGRFDAVYEDVRDEALRRPQSNPTTSSGQPAIQFRDEGVDIGSLGGITAIDFVGAGIVGTVVGGVLTLTVAGGGGGGSGITRSRSSVAVNTSAGAVALTDYVYVATAAGITITLPTAVGNTNEYVVKNNSAGNITVASTSAQTFDGTASPIILVPGQSLTFYSDNANWILA